LINSLLIVDQRLRRKLLRWLRKSPRNTWYSSKLYRKLNTWYSSKLYRKLNTWYSSKLYRKLGPAYCAVTIANIGIYSCDKVYALKYNKFYLFKKKWISLLKINLFTGIWNLRWNSFLNSFKFYFLSTR